MRPTVAAISYILCVPAVILCVGGILQSLFGFADFNHRIDSDLFIFQPAILMGGLLVGLAVNVWAVVQIGYQDNRLTGAIRVQGRRLNLAGIALCLLLLTVIVLYLLADNLQIFAHIAEQ